MSGTIAKVGSEVSGFKEGDEIFALTSCSRDGAAAEYMIANSAELAKKPGKRYSSMRTRSRERGFLLLAQEVEIFQKDRIMYAFANHGFQAARASCSCRLRVSLGS